MRRRLVGVAIVVLVSGLASAALAAPFNLAADWSTTNDGSNGWRYGRYSSVLNPATFAAFSTYDTTLVAGMGFWRTSTSLPVDPNIEKNLTANPLSPCCGLTFAPGEVAFGPYLGPAVARWTAPAGGLYDISAAFKTIQTENSSPNAYLFSGTTQLFNQTATAAGISYTGTVSLLAGQTIDFVVWGNNASNKTTQVNATITPQDPANAAVVPEPGSLLLLGSGLVALARRRGQTRR